MIAIELHHVGQWLSILGALPFRHLPPTPPRTNRFYLAGMKQLDSCASLLVKIVWEKNHPTLRSCSAACYDRIRTSINPNCDCAHGPEDPLHKFELNRWLRSVWVDHDFQYKESRHFLCECFQAPYCFCGRLSVDRPTTSCRQWNLIATRPTTNLTKPYTNIFLRRRRGLTE